ncbi:MAG: ACP phosphodiesterase [Dysgonomonas sp.]
MNFLAHAYLSFGNPDILVGNMIADFVKGKQIELYPESIQQGILLHREIDAFTDSHPVTLKATEAFRASTGKYAGAFLDVAYDYFVAHDKENIPTNGWMAFAEMSYKQIEQRLDYLPDKFRSMFMYMLSENWLYNYRHEWMIQRSMERLLNRASFLSDDTPVFAAFKHNQEEIGASYRVFFPELKAFVQDNLEKLS